MIKRLFVLNLKAVGAQYFRTGKKNIGAGKKALIAFVAFYIIVTFFGLFFMLFNTLLEPFFSAGIGWMYFAVLAVTAFASCVIGTIFTASAQLFGAKDNELLLSMPIKPSEILLSRVLVLLAFEYAFTAIIALPAFGLWAGKGYATAVGILFFFIDVILLPPMAMAVSMLLAWLLGMVTARIRRKNILTLALSIGFLAGYFYVFSNLQGYLGDLVNQGAQLAEAFQKAMPPVYAFGKSIADGSAGDGLVFIIWAVLPFALSVFLLSVNYRKVLISNRGNAKTVYREKAAKADGAFSALVRKELAHYWSKPFVILNSSVGSLCMLALSVLVIVKGSDILSYVRAPIFTNLPPTALGAVILVFLNGASNIGASLISLEGRNLWIVKSIPIPPKVVIQSKICTHMLISGFPCLIASVCAAAVFAGNLTDWAIIILLPQAACVLLAVCGLAINLQFPKLDWTNEIYVVKQGLSAMVTLFGAMGVIVGLGIVYAVLLSGVVSLAAFLWFCALLFAVIAGVIYAWLTTTGIKKFEQL